MLRPNFPISIRHRVTGEPERIRKSRFPSYNFVSFVVEGIAFPRLCFRGEYKQKSPLKFALQRALNLVFAGLTQPHTPAAALCA
jgi:hypothetical protein